MYIRFKYLEEWFFFENFLDCILSVLNLINYEKFFFLNKVIKSWLVLLLKNIFYDEVDFFDIIFIFFGEIVWINENIFNSI